MSELKVKKKQLNIIQCPHCKSEYLAAEIFYPKHLLGNPEIIIRDEDNKIEYITGSDMNLSEYYVCDKCNKKFIVNMKISFSSTLVNDDFEEEFISNL